MSATDARGLIPAAIDRFGARVHAVPADRWDGPTPCSQWSVRDLVAHMCFEHRWAPHILAGQDSTSASTRSACTRPSSTCATTR